MGCRASSAGFAAALGGLLLLGSCSKEDHPPSPTPSAMTTASDGGVVIRGDLGDEPPTCGGQKLAAVVDAPVLYFVMDRSGSMGEPIAASGESKFEAALYAVDTVLASMGHRVRYGATVYPADSDPPSCIPGAEVFPPTQGDAPSTVKEGERGRVLRTFMDRLAGHPPNGATPTAGTLLAVARQLAKVETRAYVVLVTDGAPNCNAGAQCTSADCIPDIERASFDERRCGDEGISCCDPRLLGAGAGSNCVDSDASVAAVQGLAKLGIDTYVIGMPGSEAYTRTLERLAVAGNTARDADPGYYAVTDTDALTEALLEIGTGLNIGCDVALEAAPADPALVNVYFDKKLVPQNEEDGWVYGDAGVLAIRGAACMALKSGEVRQVSVTYGCETVVR